MYKIKKYVYSLYKIFSITIDVKNVKVIDLRWCIMLELDDGGLAGSSETKKIYMYTYFFI